jgi:tetratricopeptide (TPR) repeat protein
MERGTFGSKVVALYIERHFVPVRIDDSKGPSAASQTYRVRTYPTVIFLDPAGDVLHRQAGPMTPAEFQPLMERVAALPGLIEDQKQKPDDLEANFALGNSLAILNQMIRGSPYLERAAQLDPENRKGRQSQARLILAMTPLEDGDSAKTLGLLDKFEAEFKGAPEIPIAIFYRGAVLFQDGQLVEARKSFDRLRKDYPKHPQAYEADKAILAIDGRLKALKRLEEEKKAPPAQTPAEEEPKPKG